MKHIHRCKSHTSFIQIKISIYTTILIHVLITMFQNLMANRYTKCNDNSLISTSLIKNQYLIIFNFFLPENSMQEVPCPRNLNYYTTRPFKIIPILNFFNNQISSLGKCIYINLALREVWDYKSLNSSHWFRTYMYIHLLLIRHFLFRVVQ